MPAFPDRLDNETSKAYAALCDYCAMGAGRSLDKLVDRYRSATGTVPARRTTTIKDWSRHYDWQVRVRAYDDAARAERIADLRIAHRADVEQLRLQTKDDAATLRVLGRGMAALLAKRLKTLAPDSVEAQHLASVATSISKALLTATDLDAATLGIDMVIAHLNEDPTDGDG